jgi:hypothetical protein
MQKNGNTKIAREYRKKYPEYPTKKLARVLYAENNLAFTNEEGARTCLRYIEGKQGASLRKYATSVAPELVKQGERPRNPYHLPTSDETIFEPFVFVL